MSNSSQTYANGKSPSPPPVTTAPTYSQPNSYPDVEAIRQAQREWRLAKRRELEDKARKKQFKRASLSASQAAASQSVVHAQPHVNTAALYTQVTTSQPTATHVQLPHGNMFTHSSEIQHLQIHPTSTAAIHQITQPHAQLMPQFKTPSVTSAAMALQHHLNSNAKRARSALEEVGLSSSPDDATEAAMTPAVASMYAAPATSSVGMATSIPMAGSVITAVVPPTMAEGVIQQQQDAHKMAMDQYEAQRRWREMKRREIEMKKARGAGSKRGRKKARVSVPPAISAATAQLQESVSVAIAATPSIGTTSAPTHITVQMGCERGGNTENISATVGGQGSQIVEDPTALYVKNVPSGEVMREVEDVGSSLREFGDSGTMREVEENAQVREIEDNTVVGEIADDVLEREVGDNATVREAEGNTAVVEIDDNTAVGEVDDNVAVREVGENTIVRETDNNTAVREVEDSAVVKEVEGSTAVKVMEDGITHRKVEDNTTAEKIENNIAAREAEDNSTTREIEDNASAREAEDNGVASRDVEESGALPQLMDVEMPTSDEVEVTAQKETEAAPGAGSAANVRRHKASFAPMLQISFCPATPTASATRIFSPIARPDISEAPSQLIPATTVTTEPNPATTNTKQERSAHCGRVSPEESKAVEGNDDTRDVKKEAEENVQEVDEPTAEQGEGEEAGEEEDFTPIDTEIAKIEADRSKTFIRETSNAESTESKEILAPRSESRDEAAKDEGKAYSASRNALKSREEDRGFRELSEDVNNETQGPRGGETVDESDADGKADDFPASGEDIMSAAAWQSLDSIGNT